MSNKGLGRIEILKYAKEELNTIADYPWSKNPNNAVLRHSDNKKWFGLVMSIPKNKLGINSDEIIDAINVKCDPIMIGSLLTSEGFYSAYHMNKRNWITIALDGSVPDEDIINLLYMSFKSTEWKRGF